MRFKKIISIILCVAMCLSLGAISFSSYAADNSGKLTFNSNGKFKVMMINDTQDDQNLNKRTKAFIETSIAQEKPDLVVVAGDILSDIWPGCTQNQLDACMNELCSIFQNAGVHFAITMGNHDHDRANDCSSVEHLMSVATSYSMHVSTVDGCDPATYSVPIYSQDGSKVEYVVYVMDSNNKGSTTSITGYTGLTQSQIDWYKQTAEKYKAANGGTYIPSTVIQHVPVAEIYNLLKEVPMSEYLDSGVVYSSNNKKWYKLNTENYSDLTGVLGESPCSEAVSTGEYTAWTQTGVVSAFFGHDHVNTFAGTTKEGIYMGYNGGTGFNAYGNGAKRSIRLINFDENNLTKVDTNEIYYKDVCGHNFPFYYSDVLSTGIVTVLMKIVYFVPSVFAKIFK
jgi:hypothetical protein